ncbi:endocuticle structural glycoprotein ABD-4-like [Palaemon carinicauda]|uniref:endocuticle structural glycoprotein ABD-4-like n=1 Tax=Palaemon carinicauda TaxID=392227 RepID=UPI0035B644BA
MRELYKHKPHSFKLSVLKELSKREHLHYHERSPLLRLPGGVVVADTYKTPIPILKDDRTQNAYGEYTFEFETGNGIKRNEAGRQNDGQESQGGWSYTGPEGIPIALTFSAGAQGYVPVGDHLPTPPTLPYDRTDGGH